MKIQNIVVSSAVAAALGLPLSHAKVPGFGRKLGVIGARRLEFTEECLDATETLDMSIESAYDAYDDATTTAEESCTNEGTTSTTCTASYTATDSAQQALIEACNGVTGLETFSYDEVEFSCTASNSTFTASYTITWKEFADCYAESCGFDDDSFIEESEKDFEAYLNEEFGLDNAKCEFKSDKSAASDLFMPLGWASVAASVAAMFFTYSM